jgi:hypothetical protein
MGKGLGRSRRSPGRPARRVLMAKVGVLPMHSILPGRRRPARHAD